MKTINEKESNDQHNETRAKVKKKKQNVQERIVVLHI